jgi:membrane protein YqaA with SNARE-associated domain
VSDGTPQGRELPPVTEPSRAPTAGLLGALFWPLRKLKGLYAWFVGLAHTRWGTPALCFVSFADSSFLPVPPDPLLAALALGNRRRALSYGLLTTAASIVGGVVGWLIGRALFGTVVAVVAALGADATWFGSAESAVGMTAEQLAALPGGNGVVFYPDGYFYVLQEKFTQNAFLAYFTAALSPIPYKVFTISGGVFDVSLPTLIVASVFGRGLRFMGIAVLVWLLGDRVRPLLERYFEWITLAICALLALFLVLWW